MCHSDEHFRTGDLGGIYPIIGGHEGAGVVEEVGPGVTDLAPGDHVVFGFVPACGKCPSCARGHSNLCDVGATLMMGTQYDGTHRHHSMSGIDLTTMVCLGTFAHHTVVNQASCVKILDHYPLDKACLIGCGVTTGWGSAVYAAEVRPGDDVVVIGIGGLGISAIQGAKLAGAERIFAVDPVAFKRDEALKFGATHVAASIEEATPLVNEVTWGKNADKVICTMGVGDGSLIESRHAADGQAGPGGRDQHPPHGRDRRHPVADVADPLREAAGRHASSARPTSATTSPTCSGSTSRASSTSTAWSPGPTRSTGSTRATPTCSRAATSAAS